MPIARPERKRSSASARRSTRRRRRRRWPQCGRAREGLHLDDFFAHLSSIACQNELLKAEDPEVQNIQVKFTCDPSVRRAVHAEFKKFLKSVEEIASRADHEVPYQLNFQFFRWV